MSTAAAPVSVGFTLQRDAIQYLPEAELGADAVVAREIAATTDAPFGQLLFDGAGQPPIGLYDELLPLADALYAILPELRAGTATALGSYSQPDVLQFVPEGGDFLVTDAAGEARRYPAVAMAEAVAGCLDRLLALLRRLEPQDPRWQAKLARLAA
jgi:hypothetical protein